jgi:hypothetical protein
MKRLLLRLAAAAALFVLLAAWRAGERYAIFPNPLALELTLEPGEPHRADPLIVSGITGAGDFLAVRFDDARTVRFHYDSWGVPALISQPVTVVPGVPLRLRVTMPALDRVAGAATPVSALVRVECDGVVVLDATGQAFTRAAHQIYFGENHIGGTSCGPRLRGRITGPGGAPLSGEPGATLPLPHRVRDWAGHFPRPAVALALLSLVLVALAGKIPRLPALVRSGAAAVRRHRWFAGAALGATLGYAWLVTLGSFNFNHPEVFGSFYDFQADSLLKGRLDVPNEAIEGEAFEARGRLYGYFGPTPALLRVPFVALGLGFAKMSRALMVVYFVASLVAAYLLLREARRLIAARAACVRSSAFRQGLETRPDQAPSRERDGTTNKDTLDPSEAPPSPFAVIALVAGVGWGSTIFFLGSRALIFHEAILAGIAFALWSVWCALRHLRAPDSRWWLGALACGVASVHCRPPTGLFALTFLGCVALAIWVHRGPARWTAPALRRALLIGGCCALGQLSLNGLAWLKFRTFDPAPLAISRPYAEPGRLAHIDGKSLHLVNLPYNFDTYVLRPNFRLERGFPWFYLGSHTPRRDFPRAKIDLPDFTLAVPYAMPGLFLLATLGALGAAIARPGARLALALLWLAVLPMTLALFAAVATAQRYTGDFCPFLIAAACFGLAAAESAPAIARRFLRSLIALATVAAVAVHVAITLQYQGAYLWGVPEEVRVNYQSLRHRVDAWFGAPPSAPAAPAPPRTDVDR